MSDKNETRRLVAALDRIKERERAIESEIVHYARLENLYNECVGRIAELEAENARLRAALQAYVSDYPECGNGRQPGDAECNCALCDAVRMGIAPEEEGS